MAVAGTVGRYLWEHSISYDAIEHEPTSTSGETAQASHVSGDAIAKAVLIKAKDGYILAVVPATHRVRLGELGACVNRTVGLATEREASLLFSDCALGAIPPVGDAYGVEAIVDYKLDQLPDVYFEGGDHCTLIHVTHDQFAQLMVTARHGHFSEHN
jgi:Ala-tRNA(Pro) deacylase